MEKTRELNLDGQRLSLVKELKGCLGCPLESKVCVPPEGIGRNIVIIGMTPGSEEENSPTPRPLIGRSGRFLWETLLEFGIRRDMCWVTNAVKCRVGPKPDERGDIQPNAPIRKRCRLQWNEIEWQHLRGKLVVPMGDLACKEFVGQALSVVRGRVIEKDGVRFLPIWHPAYVARARETIYTWKKDLAILQSVVDRGHQAYRSVGFDVISTPGQLKELADDLTKSAGFAFDLETTSKSPFEAHAKILCCGFASKEGRVAVVDFEALGAAVEPQIRRILESDVPKVAQTAKFEILWMRKMMNIMPKNIFFDPSIAKYLLDEGTGTSVGLKQMVWRYFPEYGGYEQEVDRTAMGSVPKDKLFHYNALDAFLTLKLVDLLNAELEAHNLTFLFSEVMMPAIYAVCEMEEHGLQVDMRAVKAGQESLTESIETLRNKILADPRVIQVPDFKIDSPHSMRKLFFEVMGLTPHKRTATNKISVDKDVLSGLVEQGVSIAADISKYKHLVKMKSTYYDNYEALADDNARIHPGYNMTASKGGRLAAGKPNVQNVPNDIRDVFVSRWGNDGVLMSMDFKQIETRIVAIVADDPWLKGIFSTGGDPHSLIASDLYGVPLDKLTKESPERKKAKAVSFGLVYGMHYTTLAEREKWSVEEAKETYNLFFSRANMVKRWQERQRRSADRGIKIYSLFNRSWDLSAYEGEDRAKRAFNFPIQSAASDTNVFTMAEIWGGMRELDMTARIVASVHDEIVFDLPRREVELLLSIIKMVIGSLPKIFSWMSVPMEVSVATGDNWRDMEEVKL